MLKWIQLWRKNTGLSPYVWIVLYILPFYFILRSPTIPDIVIGLSMIILYFISYALSFLSKGWPVYFWTGVQIVISGAMSFMYSYVYFSLFLAFLIGHLKNRYAFFAMYGVNIVSTFATVNYGFVKQTPVFLQQLPFVLLSLVAVVLLPISTYNKNKEDRLQGQLEDANKRISELVKLEERQRIARDLHDTLGQKLSLIGLKSDLAGKLIDIDPQQAAIEIHDVHQTARTTLKEVREMVTQMRGTKLEDELYRVKQILAAARIEFHLTGDPKLTNSSYIVENVISMCVKEAVTNVVRHSRADTCWIEINQGKQDTVVTVRDNGIGIADSVGLFRGNGIRGLKERLEFVNGSLNIFSEQGTTVVITVPNSYQQPEEEENR